MDNSNKQNIKQEDVNFILRNIYEDLEDDLKSVHTRFPPEPNGFLHIGHAKSIILNYGIAKKLGGTFNLRFDDTNPAKESDVYVKSIMDDVAWLGAEYKENLFFASDYFDKMYSIAINLINTGKAFVCDLTADEMREHRGTLFEKGVDSPFRNRSIEENLKLFKEMQEGVYPNGKKTLRAKIDMNSPNLNMRDPVLYRISHISHHNTGDKWCIYPTYDYAHSLEDCLENITHSICTLEFEDHRPLYNWVVENSGLKSKPRQMEFAKLNITNTIMGKRYIKELVDNGEVDGWDDPRLVTISGLRRRGYTKESLWDFCDKIGVSKADSQVSIDLLEHCIREDLKVKAQSIMTVIDPLKVIITNYDENKTEMLQIENNGVNEEMGKREVPFSREIFIEREDFLENAPKKFFRLTNGKEVRLKGAYFIKCNEVIKDNDGKIIELHVTYDVATKSGSGFSERKVKGTIHWVSCLHSLSIQTRLFDYLLELNESTGEYNKNNDTIKTYNSVTEKSLENYDNSTHFQFIRNGYFIVDKKLSINNKIVLNQTVSLKNKFKKKF